ncbi:MAG: IS110 family transposase [Chlamydiae bacterium]|nr:IS110 family transposase [Chlamydiota bacterium]MBI3276900.1 IS110 family transposase [Chlamydiota bacterium]
MNKKILYVGLDVDDKAFHAGLEGEGVNQSYEFSCKPTVGALIKKLKKYRELGYELKLCYEATYLGFCLYRDLASQGIQCEVVAASLIPEMAGMRVKTDRLDCRKLAQYYMKGLLTVVHVPKEEDEVVRDLIRSRSFLVGELKRIRLHILSICRRMGIDYRQATDNLQAQYWTVAHREWLESKANKWEDQVLRLNLTTLLSFTKQVEGHLETYQSQIGELANEPRYEKKVQALVCYRGIETLTAMTVVTELGDIKRFSHPKQITSYIGLDIVEYSLGGKEKRFGITKMGNRHVRTAIVEACQLASSPPKIGKALSKRREKIDEKYIEISDRCMRRLYKKSTHLAFRGKHGNKIKVACAREMLGFIWESLRQAA